MQQHIKNDMLYLLRILKAAQKIHLYTSLFNSWESFYHANDQLEFNASLNQPVEIGEQAKKPSDTITNRYHFTGLAKIKGFRNRIVHEYTGVDTEQVFEIVKQDEPLLHTHLIPVINAELQNGNFDKEESEAAKESPYLKHVNFELFNCYE